MVHIQTNTIVCSKSSIQKKIGKGIMMGKFDNQYFIHPLEEFVKKIYDDE